MGDFQRFAGDAISMPTEAEAHAELLGRLVPVGPEGPAVTRIVNQLYGCLVVVVPVDNVQNRRKARVGVLPAAARGGIGRPLGKRRLYTSTFSVDWRKSSPIISSPGLY